jgi:hypothetical protein
MPDNLTPLGPPLMATSVDAPAPEPSIRDLARGCLNQVYATQASVNEALCSVSGPFPTPASDCPPAEGLRGELEMLGTLLNQLREDASILATKLGAAA